MSWKSTIFSHYFTYAKYGDIVVATTELIWLHHLLSNFDIYPDETTLVLCDNEYTIQLASNPTYHERTQHIEIACHFIKDNNHG